MSCNGTIYIYKDLKRLLCSFSIEYPVNFIDTTFLIKLCSTFIQKSEQRKCKIPLYDGVLYGNTGCGTDVIMKNCFLPELNENDWLYFEGMKL